MEQIKKAPAQTGAIEISKPSVSNPLNEVKLDIDLYISTRQEFIDKVNKICVEGKDYHVIQGKKSLAKGGAEKIAAIFNWKAEFKKDTETLEMLGEQKGLLAYVCTLTKDLEFVGQGRGAASLEKNAKDPNKTIKMAQKSAFIDAVLRSSGLSDFFTQDLEDMDTRDISEPRTLLKSTASAYSKTPNRPASTAQINLIKKLTNQKEVDLIAHGFTKLPDLMSMDEAKECIDFLIKFKTEVKI